MQVFDSLLLLYRKTIKHIKPIHAAVHWLLTHTLIPLLELFSGLKTMPDDPFWFRLELLTGRHEAETVQLFARLVKPGMTVLDIGAHVGYYARQYARYVGESGRVFAFEPHPRTFSVLQRNIANLKNVHPIQAAVSDETGTAELYDYLMMSASGSLHYDETMIDFQKAHLADTDFAPRIAEDFPIQKYEVQTLCLDDYLPQQGVEQVDVIKMDIEGAEISALRGLQVIIHQSPGLALIMEYNPHALNAFDLKPEEALQEVLAMGFTQVHAIEADGTLSDWTGNVEALQSRTAQLMQNMGVINLLLRKSS